MRDYRGAVNLFIIDVATGRVNHRFYLPSLRDAQVKARPFMPTLVDKRGRKCPCKILIQVYAGSGSGHEQSRGEPPLWSWPADRLPEDLPPLEPEKPTADWHERVYGH